MSDNASVTSSSPKAIPSNKAGSSNLTKRGGNKPDNKLKGAKFVGVIQVFSPSAPPRLRPPTNPFARGSKLYYELRIVRQKEETWTQRMNLLIAG